MISERIQMVIDQQTAEIAKLREIIDGLANERHDLINACDNLKDKVFLAVKALEHYTDDSQYCGRCDGMTYDTGNGDVAREALAEIKRISREGVSQ